MKRILGMGVVAALIATILGGGGGTLPAERDR